MLVITRKVGESIFINCENKGSEGNSSSTKDSTDNYDKIEVVVLEMGKNQIKLGVKAPKKIKIMRSELVVTKKTNVEASKSLSKDALDALMNFNK